MGKVMLTQAQKRGISIAAVAVAALMLIDTVYQIGMHVRWRQWMPEALAAESGDAPATQPASTQPADGKKEKKPKPPEVHAAIKKRNIFMKVKGKPSRPPMTGVFANMAMFKTGDKVVWIEEGKSGHGIKVVSIKGYDVTVEWQGKTETLNLFTEKGGGGGPSRPSRGGRPGPPPGRGKATAPGPARAVREMPEGVDVEELRKKALERARSRAKEMKIKMSEGSMTIDGDAVPEDVIVIENEP